LTRTRLAPTPSGYLHAGNAWSFLLTWLLARSRGGKIHLRIDDLDAARFREEYLEDIFLSLRWLGLDWDSGPADPADFHAAHSQRLRREAYRSALTGLDEIIYGCACSREQVKRASLAAGRPGIYPGTCRDKGLPAVPARIWQSGKGIESPAREIALRLRVPGDAQVTLAEDGPGRLSLRPGEDIGDFVLWQRNGEPSYHLASVVDDQALGIDLVVRGRDLLPSTGAQAYLAERLGANGFTAARFRHHGLLLGPSGEKLSKSSGGAPVNEAFTLKALRLRPGGRESLLAFFASRLGIPGATDARGILAGFDPGRIPQGDLLWEDFAGTIAPA
jgi:glutamyl/glutaminyl-tRNA synthetase